MYVANTAKSSDNFDDNSQHHYLRYGYSKLPLIVTEFETMTYMAWLFLLNAML